MMRRPRRDALRGRRIVYKVDQHAKECNDRKGPKGRKRREGRKGKMTAKRKSSAAMGEPGDGETGMFRPSRPGSWRTGVLAFIMLSSVCTLPFVLRSGSAHEPITTKVRFNKEVIRVLQRSCLGCHRPGGIAMSLATYDEARPWAKAIKEELLEKRVPHWHPMKGYGEFRNSPSLTQQDVDLVVNWVEGGAAKGEDKA